MFRWNKNNKQIYQELKQHIDGKGKVLFERGVSEWRGNKIGDIVTLSYGENPKKDLLNTRDFSIKIHLKRKIR
jgi:hypothetical protein